MDIKQLRECVDVVIISIRDQDEIPELCQRFSPQTKVHGSFFEYLTCRLRRDDGQESFVAIVKCAKGALGAQAAMTQLIAELAPPLIILVGIAGGLPHDDFSLGDVVVSTGGLDVTDGVLKPDKHLSTLPRPFYLSPKASKMVEALSVPEDWNVPDEIRYPRPPVHLPPRLLNGVPPHWGDRIAKSLQANFGDEKRDRKPKHTVGTFASSDHFIADPASAAEWEKFVKNKSGQGRLVVTEMELVGLHRAAELDERRHVWFSIRGISDIIGLERDKAFSTYAAATAAAFTWSLVKSSTLPVRAMPGRPVRILLEKYRARWADQYAYHRLCFLKGIGSGAHIGNTPIRLDAIFQKLRLTPHGVPAQHQSFFLAAEALVERKRPLVVSGNVGSGKTTWLRWMFQELLRRDDALPILIELRQVVRHWTRLPPALGQSRSIDGYLESLMTAQGCPAQEILRLLHVSAAPRPILLIDGWDELGELGEEFRGKLLGFMREYPQVLVVVTSRPYGLAKPSHSDGFELFRIEPLEHPEVLSFAETFYGLIHAKDPARAKASLQRFVQTLEASAGILSLAANPLLLTMMLSISSTGYLPAKRHTLYQQCLQALLSAVPDRRDYEGVAPAWRQFCPDDEVARLAALSELAHNLRRAHGANTASFSAEQLAKGLPSAWTSAQKRGFVIWLSNAASILNESVDGQYSFVHRSFHEFLFAWYLFERRSQTPFSEVVQDLIVDGGNWEILRLLGGLISTEASEAEYQTFVSAEIKYTDVSCLIGTMMADGIGTDASFDCWLENFVDLAKNYHPAEMELCNEAWRRSGEKFRIEKIRKTILQHCAKANWLQWLNLRQWTDSLGLSLSCPLPAPSTSTGALLHCLTEPPGTAQQVAVGRLLCGGVPTWPEQLWEIALLNVWPGLRRQMGLTLQMAATLGVDDELLKKIASGIAGNYFQPVEYDNRWIDLYAKTTKTQRLNIYYQFRRKFEYVEKLKPHTAHLAEFLAEEWMSRACISSLNWAEDWLLDLLYNAHRPWAADLLQEIPNGHIMGGYYHRDFDHPRSKDFGKGGRILDWARWAADLYTDFLAQPPIVLSMYDRLSILWRIDLQKLGLLGLCAYENLSVGRVAARVRLATLPPGQSVPAVELLAAASRASLWGAQEELPQLLAAWPAESDPLWPALARQVARLATPEDRDLLGELAAHPEQREPPLQWGLKYLVRGDVVLEDGRELTLDELTSHLSFPTLPLLEEVARTDPPAESE